MKTILVVAYHYPPEEGSTAEMNIRIISELLFLGYKVIVLTKNGGVDEECINNENLLVLRTPCNGVLHPQKDFEKLREENINRTGNLCKIKRQIKTIISNMIIPDSVIDWYFEVKKYFKEIENHVLKADLVLSISSPYSSHIITHWLSQKLNIPYILSYGDPWIYEPKRKRGPLRYRIEYQMEKKLLKDAAQVLLITEWNKNKYQELYDIDSEKISTFNIGFDALDCRNETNLKREDDTIIKILYGGSLDPVHRDPEPFLRAMKGINNIHADIYNNDANVDYLIKKYDVGSCVNVHPLISSKEFNELMYEYDALILFGNRTPFQVPGKLFTYISTNKFILYIKNNDCNDDASELILKEYGYSGVAINDSAEIQKVLTELPKIVSRQIEPNTQKFEYHVTMRPFSEAIEKVF